MMLTNPAFDWSFIFQAMQQRPVLRGFYIGTLLVTVLAMVVGIVGGVILAVMRLSPNPVLSGVAWLFTWFFRSVPRYVLLTIMGALGILFQKGGLSLGIPFDWKIMELLGLNGNLRFLSLNANELFAGLFGAVLGLGLSEAAYMAEIARAGILSVDPGQSEAAQAIGMNRAQSMRRVILPQAMRVIVPPTGNETIAMLKDTSLLIAIPLGDELFFQLTSIGSRTYRTFEVLVAAVIFYLFATSILMVGQYYIERHFGRGFGQKKTKTRRFARPAGAGGA
jgi:polar amino acid transport system permease protein